MKKFLLLMLTVLFMMPLAVKAQMNATFGTGTLATTTGGAAGAPMSAGTIYSYVQNIYTASEFAAAGVPAGSMITEIAFSCGTNTTTVMHNCRTYMGHRATESFSSVSDLTLASDLSLVDSSDWATNGIGWFAIPLQTPFVWNGVDNVVVAIAFGGAGAGLTNCGYNYTVMTGNKQLRRYSSYNNAGASQIADPTFTGSTLSGGSTVTQSVSPNRPNLKITYITSSCPSFTPATAHIGAYTADLHWMNYNQSIVSWDLLYGETGTFDTLSGGISVNNLTDTFYTLSGLSASTAYTVYLKSYCSSETGSWSFPRHFTTDVSCPHPRNLTVQGVSGNTVDLSWKLGDAESNWDIYITTSSTLPDANTVPTASVTDTFYTDYTLNPSTDYYAYVRANCGNGDVSTWEGTTFATTCMPITTLPLMEDFDSESGSTSTTSSTNNLPHCWNHLCGSYSSYSGYPIIYSSSTYASSGSNAVRFYTGTTTTDYGNQFAIMPAIDVSTYPMSNLQVSFDMRKNNTTYASFMLIVGVMGNPTDATTFVPVDTVINTTTTYENYTVYLSNYTGQGSCIAFMAPRISQSGVSYNTGFLDNVVVEPIPSCLKPTDVTISNITAIGADIDWVPGDQEYSWEVAYVSHGDDLVNAIVENAYTHPHTLTSLNDNTQYDIYVRADCGGGDYSSWTFYKTFTTTPFCSSPIDLTVSQIQGTSALISWSAALYGANDYTVEYTEDGQNNWSSQIVSGTSCFISGLQPATSYQVRVSTNCTQGTANDVNATFTTGCLAGGEFAIGNGTTTSSYFPVYTLYKNAYSQQIFLASEMNGPRTISSVSFNMGVVNQQRNYQIYLMHTTQSTSTTWIPANNAQLCFQGAHNYVTGWNTFNFSTPFQYNGTDNLVLIVIDQNSSYTSGNTNYVHTVPSGTSHLWYSDTEVYSTSSTPGGTSYTTTTYRNNVKFGGECDSTVTCIAPNVNIADVTYESITVDWVPGYNESSWNLEYSTDNTNWTPAGSVTTAPYTITGLTSDTPYYVRLQSDCGSGETSNWVTVETRTACTNINVPYFENFDDAPDSGAGNMVTCWTRNTSSATAYPYTSSTQHHSGDYSVYFYGTTAYYSYLASPRFDDQVQMDNLKISFYAYKTSAAYNIEVGIMTDPDDYNTFVKIGNTLSPSTNSTWEMFEVNTDTYTGNGRYVAFRIPAVATSNMYIDDINIDNIPFCEHVNNIQVNNTTLGTTSADITWSAGGTETDWEVVYGLSGSISNPSAEIPEYVSGTPTVTLTGLSGDTQYDVFVRANCGGSDYSIWMNYSFRTACAEISTLPYINNFDTYGTGTTVYPSCWGKINTYTSGDRPYINTSGYSAPGLLYFYAGTSGTYNIAIMPAIDATIPVNTLRAKFMYKGNSSSDRLIVGVMTNPTDANTFVEVSTISPASTASTWTEKTVDFSTYNGTGRYIAFKNAYTSTSAYAYLDNLNVDYLPACQAPTNLAVSNLTTTSADITWDADPSENVWEVLVTPANVTNPDFTNADMVYTNSYALNSLSETTDYTVYVHTVCANGGGNSDWAKFNFSTPHVPAQTPYFCDFEDGVENANWSFQNTATNKWYIGNPTGYADSVMFVSDNGVSADYSITSPCVIWAYRDIQFDATSAEFELSFNWQAMGESTIDYMHAYIGDVLPVTASTASTLTVPTGLIQLDETRLNQQNSWQHFRTILNGSYAGQVKRLYFVWRDDSSVGTAPAAVVDSIQIVGKTCGTPYNVHAENLTSTSADVVFSSAPSMSSWEYVVTTSATADPDNEIPTSAYTNIINLSSLIQNTTYYVYVRSDCGGEYSFWSTVYSFTTLCDEITVLPFSDNFDSYTGSTSGTTNNLPSCWDYINTGTYSTYIGYPIIYSTTSYASSTPNSLRFYSGTSSSYDYGDEYAILPPIDATIYPMNSLQLTMDVRKYSTSYTDFTLVVGIMEGATASSFVPIDTITQSNTTYDEYTVYFNNYQGTGGRIALMSPRFSPSNVSYNAGNVDNIVVEPIPSCPKPVDVQMVSATPNDITISWTEVGTAGTWNIEYGPTGFTLGTGMTTNAYGTPTTTISGLNASTQYDFYVQSDCGGSDISAWSNVLTVATACGEISLLPFSDDFDSYTGSTSGTTNNLPNCWNYINTGTYSTYIGYPIIYSTTSYASSTPNSLRFYAGTSSSYDYGDEYAILPPIDVTLYPMNTLQITMDVRKYSTTYSNFTLVVGIMEGATASSFVPVDTITQSNTTYDEYTVYFNDYQGTGNRIALMSPRFSPSNVSYNAGNVDNIVVEPIPSCPKPKNIVATANTFNSITISWTEIGSATTWNVEYGPAGFTQGSGTVVTATTNPFTVTGLSASTTYDFYVRSDCGGGDLSYWSNKGSGNTQCAAITQLPYTENFDANALSSLPSSGAVAEMPACWERINTYSSPRPFSYTTNAYSGASLYFYATSTSFNIAIMPEIDASIPLNSLKATFMYRGYSTTYTTPLEVGVMTNPLDASTFVSVATVPFDATITNWVSREVSFSTYTGTGRYIAFRNGSTSATAYAYIDDLVVDFDSAAPPTPCPAPTGLNVSNVTQTSATVAWTAGTTTAWDLQYKLASSSDWGSIIPLTTATYNLTGLTANTQYKVRVRSNCGDDQSNWSAEKSFTTDGGNPGPCADPTNLTATNATANSVVLDWTENGTATSWTVNYKADNVNIWSTATATEHPYTLTGLTAETDYSVYVISNCTSGQSGASNLAAFTTSANGVETYEMSTSLYPNPNSGQFTIRNAQFTITGVNVYDAYGKLLKTVEVNGYEATIDATAFANGIYFARISTEKGVVTKSFIKK